jgi:hypothetical protein
MPGRYPTPNILFNITLFFSIGITSMCVKVQVKTCARLSDTSLPIQDAACSQTGQQPSGLFNQLCFATASSSAHRSASRNSGDALNVSTDSCYGASSAATKQASSRVQATNLLICHTSSSSTNVIYPQSLYAKLGANEYVLLAVSCSYQDYHTINFTSLTG